ncbi:MAG: hypothetical protein AAF198_06185 [Pseudomonadota bacterium]
MSKADAALAAYSTNVSPDKTIVRNLWNNVHTDFGTIAELVSYAGTDISAGDTVSVGGMLWDIVADQTYTEDSLVVYDLTGTSLQAVSRGPIFTADTPEARSQALLYIEEGALFSMGTVQYRINSGAIEVATGFDTSNFVRKDSGAGNQVILNDVTAPRITIDGTIFTKLLFSNDTDSIQFTQLGNNTLRLSYDDDGTISNAALLDGPGTSLTEPYSFVTREKGDARYAPFNSGSTLLEVLQPTTDTATVTFTADISQYDLIYLNCFMQVSANASVNVLIGDGTTFYTLGSSNTQASGSANSYILTAHIDNPSKSDGTDTVTGIFNTMRGNTTLDLSNNGVDRINNGQETFSGYQDRTISFNTLRIECDGGTFEGSNADQRSKFKLYGIAGA